jgi:hypothetical protein
MNKYNDKWTRENFLEYRKLKRSGYTDKMLKEHFGDDIYYSGFYNKNSSKSHFLKMFNEIVINPIETPYNYWEENSLFYENKKDYFAEFETDKGNRYILSLTCFYVNNIETYSIMFTLKNTFEKYYNNLKSILQQKGKLEQDDMDYLKSIFEKETNIHEIYDVMKRISYILFDIYKHLDNKKLSLGETDNYRKLKLYRNIIKSSFPNIEEEKVLLNNKYDYYLYKIK